MDDLTLFVFDQSITLLGAVDVLTGLVWNEKFADAGSFELWAPLTEENLLVLQEDNILWAGGKSAAVIEYKELIVDEDDGKQTIHCEGRTCECYMDFRTIYPRIAVTARISDILRKQVNDNLINPVNQKRKMPNIYLASSQDPIGASISYQRLGSTVLLQSSELAEANGVGFRMEFDPINKRFTFVVYEGKDRTIDQNVNDPVYFSSELDDILASSYYHNKSELRTTAYVAGEGEGTNRKIIELNNEPEAYARRELFVDARDLQTETEGGQTITDAEYTEMLKTRGKESLAEYKDIEAFSATLRIFGVTSYVYGQDFFLGDIVTIYDSRLKVKMNAMVTQATITYDEEGRKLDIEFGFGQPTIVQKIKRRFS